MLDNFIFLTALEKFHNFSGASFFDKKRRTKKEAKKSAFNGVDFWDKVVDFAGNRIVNVFNKNVVAKEIEKTARLSH